MRGSDQIELIHDRTHFTDWKGRNPEDCITVGSVLQSELDGKKFIDKMSIKCNVKNLIKSTKKAGTNTIKR